MLGPDNGRLSKNCPSARRLRCEHQRNLCLLSLSPNPHPVLDISAPSLGRFNSRVLSVTEGVGPLELQKLADQLRFLYVCSCSGLTHTELSGTLAATYLIFEFVGYKKKTATAAKSKTAYRDTTYSSLSRCQPVLNYNVAVLECKLGHLLRTRLSTSVALILGKCSLASQEDGTRAADSITPLST